ncbi:MAG: choice-of-anchor X domain-containing protein [Thermoplasmatota archaeon]
MKHENHRPFLPLAVLGAIVLILVSSLAITITFEQGADAYSTRRDLSKVVPYHAAVAPETTGEACLQMVFDYWGPSIPQQDIRNVTSGRLDTDVASAGDLVRAAHFSDQSWARGNLRGYNERSLGYGGFYYDWNDDSPRANTRFTDIYEALTRNHIVMVYMYKDFPPQLNPPDPQPPDPNNPQPPEPPQVTPEDLAGLEKVWRLVVGYDSDFAGGQLKLHDPLPVGEGARGGANVYLSRNEFDSLWNIFELEDGDIGTHRYGMTAAPWSIAEIDSPKNVEAGTEFQISANITYQAPPVMTGVGAQSPTAYLKLPEDFSMAEGGQSKTLRLSSPRSFDVVTWNVMAPDRTYVGQDYRFFINATGTVVVSDPAHRDNVGASASFEVEAFGFLNHPPQITSASVDPDYIPDDGSRQPLFTCMPTDEDGNLYRITIDMSPIGGSADQRMYDDGSNGGDQIEEDGIYSYRFTREAPVGEWTFKMTVRDSKGAEAYANVTLNVDPLSEFTEPPEIVDSGADPAMIPNDGVTTATIWALVQDAENDIEEVIADLTPLGGENDQELNDEGVDGDLFSKDDNYSYAFAVSPIIPLDKYQIEITAIDETGHETVEKVWVDVVLPPVPPTITEVIVDPITVVNDGKEKVQVIATVEDDNDDVEEVWIDLTPLRGSSEARMSYEGGDVWSLEFTVDESVTPGQKNRIEVTARDLTGLLATGSFSLTVEKANSPPRIDDLTVSGMEVEAGDEVTVMVNVSDEDFEPMTVEVDLGAFLIEDIQLLDDGVAPDEEADDGTFSGTFEVPILVFTGNHTITITVRDSSGGVTSQDLVLMVVESESSTSDVDLGNIAYIGLPIIGLVILIGLVAAVVIRNRMSGKPKQMTQGFPPGRPGMPPPRNFAPPPMGPRPMR